MQLGRLMAAWPTGMGGSGGQAATGPCRHSPAQSKPVGRKVKSTRDVLHLNIYRVLTVYQGLRTAFGRGEMMP